MTTKKVRAGARQAPPTGCNLVASTNGSDITGDGSVGSPYATVVKLISALSPGQIGCLRQGTYNDATQWTVTTPGVTITSYPGERATVNGSPDITSPADGTTLSYLNINLNMLIPVGGEGACPGQTMVAQAVLIDADNVTLEHDNIYQSNVPQLDRGNGIGIGWNPEPQTSISGITVRYNRIHDYSAGCGHSHGIYVAGVNHSQFYRNWIYNGPANGVGGAAIQLYDGHAGVEPYDNDVYSNVFDHVGLGIYLWGDEITQYKHNITDHNVVTHTTHYGGFESNAIDATNSFTDSDGYNIYANYWPCSDCGTVTHRGNLEINPHYSNAAAGDFTVNAPALANWGLPTAAQMDSPRGAAVTEGPNRRRTAGPRRKAHSGRKADPRRTPGTSRQSK